MLVDRTGSGGAAQALLERFVGGEQGVMSLLVERYQSLLYGAARRAGCPTADIRSTGCAPTASAPFTGGGGAAPS